MQLVIAYRVRPEQLIVNQHTVYQVSVSLPVGEEIHFVARPLGEQQETTLIYQRLDFVTVAKNEQEAKTLASQK